SSNTTSSTRFPSAFAIRSTCGVLESVSVSSLNPTPERCLKRPRLGCTHANFSTRRRIPGFPTSRPSVSELHFAQPFHAYSQSKSQTWIIIEAAWPRDYKQDTNLLVGMHVSLC